jgi:flagellar motor switch protein FliG
MTMRLREDYSSLSGPDRAALLIMAIGEENAAKLFPLMDDEEIREITQAMSNLGTVSSNVVERLFSEFAEQISGTGGVVGNYANAERVLNQALDPERAKEIMEEIRGPAGRTMWEKLGNVNEETLANYFKNEYPQTVAVVLTKIAPDHASRVLALFPEGFAMEVVMRMLRMEAVQKEVLDDVERTLRTEFMSDVARTRQGDPHELMADIFNNLDRQTETRFLNALEERNREAAERIKQLMFTFEDLSKLDPNGVQTLARRVDKDRLTLALKGASEQVRNLFFSNMSERAAKIMREDMEAMGPVRLRDVDEAQTEIVATAKELSEQGDILLADNKGEDDFVY